MTQLVNNDSRELLKQDRSGVRTPEDVMRRLADNVKITSDEVKGLTIEVSGKVGNDEIISRINQSAEAVTIDAQKININGTISANGNFKVDTQGNMTCNNAAMNNATMTSAKIVNGNIEMISDSSNPNLVLKSTTGLENRLHGGGLMIRDDTSYNVYVAVGTIGGYDGRTNGYITLRSEADPVVPSIELLGETGQINANYIELGSRGLIYLDGGDGNITCVSLTQTSKEEYKKNFEKLENALDIVKGTDIYKYNLKSEKETDKKHIGFVIGDKFNYRKEITSKENDGVDIYSMVSVLWKAVQEQQKEIEELKKVIK